VPDHLIRRALGRARRRIAGEPPPAPADLDLEVLSPDDRWIVERALQYTMTGVPRLHALVDAVRYCVRRRIPGALAECGVWRGGSVLAMILTLQDMGIDDRDIYLYDTFEGMTEPTEHDVSAFDRPAVELWEETHGRPWPGFFDPETFNEESVRENLRPAGYPDARLHFVSGPVEETLPSRAPERLALLRLDTDWYESTRHELEHLYPRISQGGVLIVDDYGHWEGCRRAVDEYFDAPEIESVLLSRIDYSGRLAIKH
jgi:O-methyltransferase